jgi:hypothetical protein
MEFDDECPASGLSQPCSSQTSSESSGSLFSPGSSDLTTDESEPLIQQDKKKEVS